VTDPVALDDAVRDLDRRIGLDRLLCLHVNDSKTPLGSNRDRHDSLGQGVMGNGLGTFLAHPAFQELPAILETARAGSDGIDAAEVSRLRRMHANAIRRRARAGDGQGRRPTGRAAKPGPPASGRSRRRGGTPDSA
jgi:deoxyribonuclease-4